MSDQPLEPGNGKPEEPPPPPPIVLPKPDGFGDPNQTEKVLKERAKAEKKRRKEARRHPKDAYEELRQRKGCGCGAMSLLLLMLLGLPLVAAGLWISKVKSEFSAENGFAWVTVDASNVMAPPEGKSAYVGTQVLYEVADTRQEVAFLGGAWWLSGTFHQPVFFRGLQLTLEPGTVFLQGLDVEAARYIDGGARIEGELTGRILHQSAPAAGSGGRE